MAIGDQQIPPFPINAIGLAGFHNERISHVAQRFDFAVVRFVPVFRAGTAFTDLALFVAAVLRALALAGGGEDVESTSSAAAPGPFFAR